MRILPVFQFIEIYAYFLVPQFSPKIKNPFLLPHHFPGAVLIFCAGGSLPAQSRRQGKRRAPPLFRIAHPNNRRLQDNDTIPGRSHDLSACAGLPAPGCKFKPPADQKSPQDAASAWTRPAGGFLLPRPPGALRRTRSVRAFLFRYIFL